MVYVVSFLALAAIPLALAAYGGHLATTVLDAKKRQSALRIVWGLAALGVLFSAVQQYLAYRSDKEHDTKQAQLRDKLDASLLAQEYMRGQLNSISLIISKLGESGSNVQLKDLASAIEKMAQATARATAATSRENPPASLKRRAAQLSADILGFLAARRAAEPQFLASSPQHREEELRQYMALSRETMGQFMTRFQVPCVTIADELKGKGLDTGRLRTTCEHPTNPLGIEAAGTELGVLAGRVP